MRLFQYWDTGKPPEDVLACIQSVRELNRELEHQLFDNDRAAWFVGKRIGERERRAFEALAVPALQADYFRLCALWAKGGMWIDADLRCVASLAGLMERAPTRLMLFWEGHIENSLIMVRGPQDPFIGACMEFATRNIEARRFLDLPPAAGVPAVAGPDLVNLIWMLVDPEAALSPWGRNWEAIDSLMRTAGEVEMTDLLRRAVMSTTLFHVFDVAAWIETPQPAYKRSKSHWMFWEGPIYRPSTSRPHVDVDDDRGPVRYIRRRH